MGVQNLWTLLAPVGRQVEIESLAGQVLAVDASIWLTQFVKAMRDDEGNMIRNAHLLGTLYRVAKLLFYGVRPVFVFDGQTPEIKKRTTARRRKRQEQQTANLRHTAQRLLLNRLKQQRQEVLKAQSSTALAAAVAPGFTLPKARDARKTEEMLNEEKIELTNGAYDGGGDDGKEKRDDGGRDVGRGEILGVVKQEATIEEKQMQGVWEAAAEFEEESGDLTLDDVELDTSRLSKIDLHAVFSLPPHLQKDMVQKILRDRRQEVRDQFIPLAGKPEKYSHAQISAFLQTSSLNRRIDAAKKQKRQEEMERQGGVGQGHRIDSNSNRFYIYQKDADHKEKNGQDEDDKKTAERVDMTERSLVNERIQPREAQVDAFEVDRKGPSSTLALERFEHTLHDNAKEIAAALAARYQVRVKQEPVLAIERLRQSRLKKDKPSVSAKPAAAKVVAARPSSSDVSVELKLDEVDPEEMARFQKLFPACKTERVSTQVATAKSDPDDDDDDVEWEEAASSTVEQSKSDTLGPGIAGKYVSQLSAAAKPSSSVKAAAAEKNQSEGGRSDDEIDWEEVDDKGIPVGASDENAKVAHFDVQYLGQNEQHPLDLTVGDEQIDDHNINDAQGTDELLIAMKDEIEDAKGHEDLHLLKDEALRSAMTTASNLTQWAAGAVRRALQAHSLQHGKRVEAFKRPAVVLESEDDSRDVATRDMAKDSREIVSKKDELKPAAEITQNTAEVVVIENDDDASPIAAKVDKGVEDSDKQLRAAVMASIASEHNKLDGDTGNASVRYLQYTQPRESPQASDSMDTTSSEMDTVALQKEQRELKKLRGRQSRDTEGISDDMVGEVMALLRLFGVPFLVSPMEAEAQCAALEQLGLVDGVITDDSDIFPFGGKRVYKNIFHHQKFVEAFSARDIELELGFSREQIIAFALLLGSDYTDGVRGIGIVNATEIAAAYPGIEGLREFKEWVTTFDVAEEAQRVASGVRKKKVNKENDRDLKEGGDESDGDTARKRFQLSHASARRKWELGDEFPNKQVIQAYMAPQVDRSDARFSWSAPDLAALRNYCANAFGWDKQKSDGVLQPLEEKARAASRHIQTRLDRFFTSYDDRVHYAQIQSKRLRSAVSQGTGSKKKKKKRK